MPTQFAPAIALLLCGSLAAQGFVSSPTGYEFSEGSSDSRDVLGTMPLLRYQQVDSTSGALSNRTQLAFRRDGWLFTSSEYRARTIDVEVVMAESSVENLSSTFASNYLGNQAVVVTRKQIQLPDWTQRPIVPPASLDAIIPLDTAWSYAGKQASNRDMLWEFKVWGNTEAGREYPFDLEYVIPNATFGTRAPSRSGHVDLGSGCQVALGEAHMDVDVFNYGNKFTLDAHLHTAPNSPVTLMIGLFNANLSHPALCAKLHVIGIVNIAVGIAGPTGDFDIDIDPITYNPAYIGADMYFQTVAPDTSQASGGYWPLALSSGAKLTVPGDPQGPAVGRLWAPDPNATTATAGPVAGGIIAHTSQ